MYQDESSSPNIHESHHKTCEYYYITRIIKNKCCNDASADCYDGNCNIPVIDKSITTFNQQYNDCCRRNSLKYYIKTKINSSSDEECGCHYDHPCSLSSSLSPTSELNDCESDTCGVYGVLSECHNDEHKLDNNSVKATYNNITDDSSDELCNEYDLSSVHCDANRLQQLRHDNQIMSWPSSLETFADNTAIDRHIIENCKRSIHCHERHINMGDKDKNILRDDEFLHLAPPESEMLKSKNTVGSFRKLSSKSHRISTNQSNCNYDKRKKWCSCLAGNMSQTSAGYDYSHKGDDESKEEHQQHSSISSNSCYNCNSNTEHSNSSSKKKRSHHKRFLSHMNFLLSSSLAPSHAYSSDKNDNAKSSKTKTKKSQASWSNLFKRNKTNKSRESITGSFVGSVNSHFDDLPSIYSDELSNDLERRAGTPSSLSISLVTNLESDSSELCPNNARQSLPSRINTRSFHQNPDYFVTQRLCVRSSCGHRTPDGSDNNRAQSLPASPQASRRLITSNRFIRSPRLNKSPVHFQSPPSVASKIEDGLKVCSSEHFEKHIGNLKEDSNEAQKRVFLAWINHFCPFLIKRDVVEELRDGVKLIGLLANLTKDKNLLNQYEKLRNRSNNQSQMNGYWNFNPGSRLKQLADISMAIKFLEKQNMKLVNLNPMDIVDGKASVILALCWNIILHFQIEQNFKESMSQAGPTSSHTVAEKVDEEVGLENKRNLPLFRRRLLNKINDEFDLSLTNRVTNLTNGNVLLTILKRLIPELNQSDFELDRQSKLITNNERQEYCLSAAQKYLKIPRIVTIQDLNDGKEDKFIMLYLSMLLDAKTGKKNAHSHEPFLLAGCKDETTDQQFEDAVEFQKYLSSWLNDINDDSFNISELHFTLSNFEHMKNYVYKYYSKLSTDHMDKWNSLQIEIDKINQIKQWINTADEILSVDPISENELQAALNEHEEFFVQNDCHRIVSGMRCAALINQFEECHNVAKCNIKSYSELLLNWDSYNNSKDKLRKWLIGAESKLNSAIKPHPTCDDIELASQKSDRLDDLIAHFDLNMDESDRCHQSPTYQLDHSPSPDQSDEPIDDKDKPLYMELFDDFAQACKVLSSKLDSDNKQKLSTALRELRSRLNYIINTKLPQVIMELNLGINASKMCIIEQPDCTTSTHEELIFPTGVNPELLQEQHVCSQKSEKEYCFGKDSTLPKIYEPTISDDMHDQTTVVVGCPNHAKISEKCDNELLDVKRKINEKLIENNEFNKNTDFLLDSNRVKLNNQYQTTSTDSQHSDVISSIITPIVETVALEDPIRESSNRKDDHSIPRLETASNQLFDPSTNNRNDSNCKIVSKASNLDVTNSFSDGKAPSGSSLEIESKLGVRPKSQLEYDLYHSIDSHTEIAEIFSTKIETVEQHFIPVITESVVAKKQRYKSPKRSKQKLKKRSNERKEAIGKEKPKSITPKKVNKIQSLKSIVLDLFFGNDVKTVSKPVKETDKKMAAPSPQRKKSSLTSAVCKKLIAAFRSSYSLNIVLLVCLAGLCLMPLIYKDSCCELSDDYLKPLGPAPSETPI